MLPSVSQAHPPCHVSCPAAEDMHHQPISQARTALKRLSFHVASIAHDLSTSLNFVIIRRNFTVHRFTRVTFRMFCLSPFWLDVALHSTPSPFTLAFIPPSITAPHCIITVACPTTLQCIVRIFWHCYSLLTTPCGPVTSSTIFEFVVLPFSSEPTLHVEYLFCTVSVLRIHTCMPGLVKGSPSFLMCFVCFCSCVANLQQSEPAVPSVAFRRFWFCSYLRFSLKFTQSTAPLPTVVHCHHPPFVLHHCRVELASTIEFGIDPQIRDM